jgi:hypothetical protein
LGAGDKRSSDLLKTKKSVSLFIDKVRSITNFVRKGVDSSYPGVHVRPSATKPLIFLGTQNHTALSSLHETVDGYIGNTGSIHELSFLLDKISFESIATFVPVFFPDKQEYYQRNVFLLNMVVSSVSRKTLEAFPTEISSILRKLIKKTTKIEALSRSELHLLANEFCLFMEKQAIKQKLRELKAIGVQEILLGGISPNDLSSSLDLLRSLSPT